MIEFLSGKVLKRLPNGVILDVQGVGYGLTLPLPAVANLPIEGSAVSLWVYTRVREDAIQLFGFPSREDRLTFEILLQINGVGPKVAIAILSTLSAGSLRRAVETRDLEMLAMVPGIGKRTAEKIVVELQARLDRLPLAGASTQLGVTGKKPAGLDFEAVTGPAFPGVDLKSALENLGFKEKDIAPLLQKLEKDHSGEDFSALVRRALAQLSSRQKVQRAETPDLDETF